jgi:hypothetical protein
MRRQHAFDAVSQNGFVLVENVDQGAAALVTKNVPEHWWHIKNNRHAFPPSAG